ncbi:MAG: PhoH family protein [Bacteroidales bacterium]
MSEKIIQIDNVSPLDVYGAGDVHLEQIKGLFPKLKIIARGNYVKLIGDPEEIHFFAERFDLLLIHLDRFGKINSGQIEEIMLSDSGNNQSNSGSADDILVHGPGGLQVRALTVNQKRLVSCSDENDMMFAIGPAGTGKTYTAVALAVRALKNRWVKRIVLTRPAVEAGENLGFLPGDLKDKLDPYLMPLYDALRDMLPPQKLLTYLEDGTIEVAPLAFMRGRTLDNAFAILDEAQNATRSQMKMFLTRMGKSAKFIVTGDITQIDLPAKQPSGLLQAMYVLKDVEGISFIYLDDKDVVRHKLVTKIIQAYRAKAENSNQESESQSLKTEINLNQQNP